MSAGKKTKTKNQYTELNRVSMIHGGKPYFDCLLQMIRAAKEEIHLQTYIYDGDETGALVAEALKEAVKRNVKVYLLADGYASKGISGDFVRSLQDAGIHFRFFNPLFKSNNFYFGRRLHHKMAVVDSRYALVGGVNITNRYNDMPGKPAWLDFALYIEGEAAQQLCILCWKTWNNYPINMGLTPCEKKILSFSFEPGSTSRVAMRRNDWVRRKNEISSSYINMFLTAKSHITILCSYFLPGRFIRKQLVYAVKRGVTIRVVTAGISDVMLSKYAERYLYDWLLKNRIQLYEYQPTVLHGKIAVCDSEWLTAGSYNINNISAYASIELNMDVQDPDLASRVESELQQIISRDCIPITEEYLKRTKNIFRRFARWISYIFIRFVLYLFTFYFKHKK